MKIYPLVTLCTACAFVSVATAGVHGLPSDEQLFITHKDKHVHSETCTGGTDTHLHHCKYILGAIDLEELEILLIESNDIDSSRPSKPPEQDRENAPVLQSQQVNKGILNDVLRG